MTNRTGSPIFLAFCTLPILPVAWVVWRAYPGDPITAGHQLVVGDYLNLWIGGHLASDGRIDVIFDPIRFAEYVWSLFSRALDQHGWAYPPHMLFFAEAFSKFPLVMGFFLWDLMTATFLWSVLRAGGLPASYAFAIALSPAGLENALNGQNGALIAAALAGGLLFSQRRPILAGALLGLLTLKPQLGLLVPFFLLGRHSWKALGWGAAFGLTYCAAGAIGYGWGAWVSYFTVTGPYTKGYIDAPFGLAAHYMMIPPFITLRALGASLAVAYSGQAVVTVLSAVAAWWAGSLRLSEPGSLSAAALVLCLGPLATPYAHAYDLISCSVACGLLVWAGQRGDKFSRSERIMLALAWIWPGCAFVVGIAMCPGLGMFFVGMGVWVIAQRVRRYSHLAPGSG